MQEPRTPTREEAAFRYWQEAVQRRQQKVEMLPSHTPTHEEQQAASLRFWQKEAQTPKDERLFPLPPPEMPLGRPATHEEQQEAALRYWRRRS